MVDTLLKTALKWEGYLEKKNSSQLESYKANVGYNNYTVFGKEYNQYFGVNVQGQPWCATFVSCVFVETYGLNKQKEILTEFYNCVTGVNLFKKKKQWYNSPQKGDIIFFKDNNNVACHTGIVYEVDNNRVYTIEGNTSAGSQVVANGGGVFKKSYYKNNSRILGYGRPNYPKQKVYWQETYLNKMFNKGYITDKSQWKDYDNPVSKALCVALIDKITGGIWKSEEANSSVHWAQPHVISLCGKNIIQDKEDWIKTLDSYVSKAILLGIVDKATNGILNKYNNMNCDHWARKHLNSLCDKGIIVTPQAWDDDFEGTVNKGNFMALLCKAFNI